MLSLTTLCLSALTPALLSGGLFDHLKAFEDRHLTGRITNIVENRGSFFYGRVEPNQACTLWVRTERKSEPPVGLPVEFWTTDERGRSGAYDLFEVVERGDGAAVNLVGRPYHSGVGDVPAAACPNVHYREGYCFSYRVDGAFSVGADGRPAVRVKYFEKRAEIDWPDWQWMRRYDQQQGQWTVMVEFECSDFS